MNKQSTAQKLVQLSMLAPKGRHTLARAAARFGSNENVTLSVYGPLLKTRSDDVTFRLCAGGGYGFFLSDLLGREKETFSFIDVGANMGIYSLIAAANPACRHCFAFEPNKPVFDLLATNIALNRQQTKITASNLAISDRPEELRFKVSADHSGGGSITDDGDIVIHATDRTAFDQIAAKDKNRKIVKIDVEGHEPVVIEQLTRSQIWPSVASLFFEASEDRFDVGAVRALLEKHGLRFASRNQGAADGVYDLLFVRAT